MRKWLIIIGSVLLLLFLIGRGIYKTVNSIDDEKQWYVDNLNTKCSLQVDSVVTFSSLGNGFLLCHLISGKIDNSIEHNLNKRLVHHKRIRLLRPRNDAQYALLCRSAGKYQKGDSIRMDTDEDQMLFFRAGKSVGKAKVTNSLIEVIF